MILMRHRNAKGCLSKGSGGKITAPFKVGKKIYINDEVES